MKGIEKGIEKGKREAKYENVQRMKEDGVSLEKIAQYTGLSIEEIVKI